MPLSFINQSLLNHTNEIECPTLIIAGEFDKLAQFFSDNLI